jgi:hypothetical protein
VGFINLIKKVGIQPAPNAGKNINQKISPTLLQEGNWVLILPSPKGKRV